MLRARARGGAPDLPLGGDKDAFDERSDVCQHSRHVFFFFTDWRYVVHCVFSGPQHLHASDQAATELLRGQAPRYSGDIPLGGQRLIKNRDASSSTHGFVVMSVQAGPPCSSPSLARNSVPEHWAPSSCRAGPSFIYAINSVSATTCRVRIPMPTITASANKHP